MIQGAAKHHKGPRHNFGDEDSDESTIDSDELNEDFAPMLSDDDFAPTFSDDESAHGSDSEPLPPVRDASIRGPCPVPRYYKQPRDDSLDTAQRRRSVFNPKFLRGTFGNPAIVEMWGNRRQQRFYNSGLTPQQRIQAMYVLDYLPRSWLLLMNVP